ncbi:MAG: DUF47 domain-containing protein [Candidatus Bathycorpusculaceae bacterium]
MEKRSYKWFETRRKIKALELAKMQIIKALDTTALLHQAAQSLARKSKENTAIHIQHLFQTESEVDNLVREIFKEMSKLTALSASYREDILHFVKRLDTLADHVKDAARSLQMLQDSKLPDELIQGTTKLTLNLVECASTLRISIEKISTNPEEAIKHSTKVEEIENKIDQEYIKTKRLIPKHGENMNPGTLILFNDLIEFIEQAADICADTADYIITLSSRK